MAPSPLQQVDHLREQPCNPLSPPTAETIPPRSSLLQSQPPPHHTPSTCVPSPLPRPREWSNETAPVLLKTSVSFACP